MSVETTAVYRWLRERNLEYAGKILELRREIESWLSYVPATFPHYTLHTVKHSDELVRQLSRLLFREEAPDQLVLPYLSPTEAYVAIAAAYLHDAGMVASDHEKSEVVASDAFRAWLRTNSVRQSRWEAIEALRIAASPPDPAQRNFLADIQVRFLLAEYLRGRHHLRSGEVVKQHEGALGRFAFGDPALQRAIADICVAHGLHHHELEDPTRFPESRDLRGDKVNLRFVAILVRLADLLDLSTERACPLLLNAACPLPSDSYAHWTQYQNLDRDVAPDRIEITARCDTAEEHRLLRDWCKWIVDEVGHASVLMAHARRHRDWKPPRATLGPEHRTITIERSDRARYVPVDWKFELDESAVFERLVRDAYDGRLAFVRELVQNALDAMRCRMYEELEGEGLEPPAAPNLAPEDILRRYVLDVQLVEREVDNPLSGGRERRQVVIVEDCGIGMDREVIRRHLLQVGRSFYITDEFRRRYSFVPTSRFGVGFLSVFAESDHVVIETCKPTSRDGGIRLSLRGPRGYLLVEEHDRRSSGTRIEVELRDPLAPQELTSFLRNLCRRAEFAIRVDDLGTRSIIDREPYASEKSEVSDPDDAAQSYFVRSRVFRDEDGTEAAISIFGGRKSAIEDWAWTQGDYARLREKYPTNPFLQLPEFSECLHGILVSEQEFISGAHSIRIDRRDKTAIPTLGRTKNSPTSRSWKAVVGKWMEELVQGHIASRVTAGGVNNWHYLQYLSVCFPGGFWDQVDGTFPMWHEGVLKTISIREALNIETFGLIVASRPDGGMKELRGVGVPLIRVSDLLRCSPDLRGRILADRSVSSVKVPGKRRLLVFEQKPPTLLTGLRSYDFDAVACGPIGRADLIALNISRVHETYSDFLTVFNASSPLVQWWLSFGSASEFRDSIKILASLMCDVARFGLNLETLKRFLGRWREQADNDHASPPPIQFSEKSFLRMGCRPSQ